MSKYLYAAKLWQEKLNHARTPHERQYAKDMLAYLAEQRYSELVKQTRHIDKPYSVNGYQCHIRTR